MDSLLGAYRSLAVARIDLSRSFDSLSCSYSARITLLRLLVMDSSLAFTRRRSFSRSHSDRSLAIARIDISYSARIALLRLLVTDRSFAVTRLGSLSCGYSSRIALSQSLGLLASLEHDVIPRRHVHPWRFDCDGSLMALARDGLSMTLHLWQPNHDGPFMTIVCDMDSLLYDSNKHHQQIHRFWIKQPPPRRSPPPPLPSILEYTSPPLRSPLSSLYVFSLMSEARYLILQMSEASQMPLFTTTKRERVTTVARTEDGGEGGGGQQMVASLNRGWWLKLCGASIRFRFRLS
ncbi:hypothetical protein DY000_02040641 [Brassica cretica]|uniref:Uncharacterized protein n=1 Tax=Brassica cretica TaxID=69181 RepID=A0ABQ7B948_BRACR|nr:hypothetical protein DY000_02040641 [Brassica cretica]